jgi:glycosyltransferase involved in cell wall biosynthesis
VNSDNFKPQNSNRIRSLRENLGNPEKIIMYAGYFDEVNGLRMILNIMPSILKNNPHITFLFIGQGPYFQQIEKMSKKYPQIRLLTSVKHESMPLYYQTSDLFIIPRPSTLSSELVTPLKLLEAMSTESIILGSNVGGIKDVIKNRKNGYIYEKDNPHSFKNSLIAALESDNKGIGKNARKTILKEYNWDASAKKLKNVYDSI